MSLNFVIVAKDLRRLRWMLLVWIGILLLPILLGIQMTAGAWAEGPAWRAWNGMNDYATFLRGLFAFLLTVMLVQEDGLVGTRQFWLTRPMSGRRLLVAKGTTGSLIFVVLPIAIALPWWLWCGFGLGHIGWAAAEVVAYVLVVAISAAFVSAVTDSFARTLLWSLVLAAGVVTIGILFITFARFSRGDGALHVTRGLVTTGVLIVFATVAVVVQFLARNPKRVVMAGLGAVGLFLVLQVTITAWPSRWLAPSEPREFGAERAQGIKVRFDQARRFKGPAVANGRFDRAEMYFAVSGVPAGAGFKGLRGDHRWTWANLDQRRNGSLSAVGWPRFFGLKDPASDLETERWRQEQARLFGWTYHPPTQPDEWRLRSGVPMLPSVVEKMTKEPSNYVGRLWLTIDRPKLGYEMPFRAGERQAGAGHSLRLVKVDLGAKLATFYAVETRPFLAIDTLRESLGRVLWFYQEPKVGYLFINREKGEFQGLGGVGQTPTVPIYGVGVNPRGPTDLRTQVVRNGEWVRRPGWFEGATVALVALETEARFFRDVRVEGLLAKDGMDETVRRE